ncbi:hypothetical protein BH11PSE1_BH11PSE1_13030 [soil metagenome]
MTDIESFKRRTGVNVEYRQFDIDALAPAPILQAPLVEAAAGPEPVSPTPPAPPGAGFGRYVDKPAEPPTAGASLTSIFQRLERQ